MASYCSHRHSCPNLSASKLCTTCWSFRNSFEFAAGITGFCSTERDLRKLSQLMSALYAFSELQQFHARQNNLVMQQKCWGKRTLCIWTELSNIIFLARRASSNLWIMSFVFVLPEFTLVALCNSFFQTLASWLYGVLPKITSLDLACQCQNGKQQNAFKKSFHTWSFYFPKSSLKKRVDQFLTYNPMLVKGSLNSTTSQSKDCSRLGSTWLPMSHLLTFLNRIHIKCNGLLTHNFPIHNIVNSCASA